MANQFTAIFERKGAWVVAYCPEIPGANGQGGTKDEVRQSLAEAIALISSPHGDSNTLARKICRGLGVPVIG